MNDDVDHVALERARGQRWVNATLNESLSYIITRVAPHCLSLSSVKAKTRSSFPPNASLCTTSVATELLSDHLVLWSAEHFTHRCVRPYISSSTLGHRGGPRVQRGVASPYTEIVRAVPSCQRGTTRMATPCRRGLCHSEFPLYAYVIRQAASSLSLAVPQTQSQLPSPHCFTLPPHPPPSQTPLLSPNRPSTCVRPRDHKRRGRGSAQVYICPRRPVEGGG